MQVVYNSKEIYVPRATEHSDCDILRKAYDNLSEAEMNMVSHRPKVYQDVQTALQSLKLPNRVEGQDALVSWSRKHETDLSLHLKAVGIRPCDIINW